MSPRTCQHQFDIVIAIYDRCLVAHSHGATSKIQQNDLEIEVY